ncbi:MAG: hypothetical protein IT364_20365, partial [Candidatus Hydrogenedentes bacterium]|nr:hypothetical protein [Candidatus Hydrogenedentota bacterium]
MRRKWRNLDGGSSPGVMADERCVYCGGGGWWQGRRARRVCACVFRRVCRIVLRRAREGYGLDVRHKRGGAWFLPSAEFRADAWLTAKRVLDTTEFGVFHHAMWLGGEWREVAARVNLSRGNYFHAVYRAEEKLGWAWATLHPYPLWPVDEYFEGNRRDDDAAPERDRADWFARGAGLPRRGRRPPNAHEALRRVLQAFPQPGGA